MLSLLLILTISKRHILKQTNPKKKIKIIETYINDLGQECEYDNETNTEVCYDLDEYEQYVFEMLVKQEIEKNVGWELFVAIISNTVSMVFVIIGAIIAFILKNYVIKMCCFNKKEEAQFNDQIDNMAPIINTIGNMVIGDSEKRDEASEASGGNSRLDIIP
jgi:hypothetical protein